MSDVKQPEDHKKKADKDLFSFEHDGETYTFPKSPRSVMTGGWLRKHRHRDEGDLMFMLLEAMADDDPDDPALKAADEMDYVTFSKFQEKLQKFNKVALGES